MPLVRICIRIINPERFHTSPIIYNFQPQRYYYMVYLKQDINHITNQLLRNLARAFSKIQM